MYHENEYHVAVKNNSPVMVGYARIWTDEPKQKYVTDLPLQDTPYGDYKAIEDQVAYVDSLTQAAIAKADQGLINLIEAVSLGLYNPDNPTNTLMVQTVALVPAEGGGIIVE
jgi:hypothetical protein